MNPLLVMPTPASELERIEEIQLSLISFLYAVKALDIFGAESRPRVCATADRRFATAPTALDFRIDCELAARRVLRPQQFAIFRACFIDGSIKQKHIAPKTLAQIALCCGKAFKVRRLTPPRTYFDLSCKLLAERDAEEEKQWLELESYERKRAARTKRMRKRDRDRAQRIAA